MSRQLDTSCAFGPMQEWLLDLVRAEKQNATSFAP
jgi:hypothetical protein